MIELWLIVILLIFYSIMIYNNLVSMKERIRNSAAQIDVFLKKRTDMITNLVESVKAYMKHEKDLFEKITEYRTRFLNATNVQDRIEASNMLSQTLKTLFAVSENYPDLKASYNFTYLKQQIADVEKDIAVTRVVYNDMVQKYNTTLKIFPNFIIAAIMGFKEEPYLNLNLSSEDREFRIKF